MQVAGPPAERHGDRALADLGAACGQQRPQPGGRGIALTAQVREDGEVAAVLDVHQERLQRLRQRPRAAQPALRGVDLDRALDQFRRPAQHRRRRALLRPQQRRRALPRLADVRLGERVDADHPARHRDRVLPQQELRAERPGDGHPRLPARARVVRPPAEDDPPQVVGQLEPGGVDALHRHREQALAVLAHRSGDQLLRPRGEPGQAGTEVGDHQLVAGPQRRRSQRRAERQCRIVVGLPQRRREPGRLVQRDVGVHAREHRRHQRAGAESAEAPVHVGFGQDEVVAGLAGGAFEGGPLLGDDDEPARQIRAAQPGLGERAPEDAPQRPGLGAVVRDHHQRPVQVPGEDAGHLVRIGGVEDGQPGARRAAERVGGQRGPPGRGQHDPVEAGAAGVGRQAGPAGPAGTARSPAGSASRAGGRRAGPRRAPTAWRSGTSATPVRRRRRGGPGPSRSRRRPRRGW
ncbi:hypothetical protein [Actinomadura madurae]|uniref:hypothetical protein n=1 Tax=Actinomadura madurae TaxID=1993 RepID=UPI0027E26A0D|nr:hypothetical protein [Actinomadura madurae]